MIYVSGAQGMVGRRFRELYKKDITTISYREKVYDVFASHKKSCLIHLAWSSTTRDKDGLKGKYDIFNSQELFNYYAKKNPNGKIIFVSTAGDMHLNHGGMFCSGLEDPNPRTVYGKSKLHVEQALEVIKCKTVVLRASNIWGGDVKSERINGLVDKLLNAVNTDKVVDIYANLDTHVDLIHLDDFINLLIKVIDTDLDRDHEMFLVGNQCISISDIIRRVSKRGVLNVRIDEKAERSFINVQPFKAKHVFDWNPENNL
jgi:nucleoside-diphosphate-sugar epimerase